MKQYLISLDIAGLHGLQSWIDPASPIQVWAIRFFSDFHIFFMAGLLVVLWLYAVFTRQSLHKESALYVASTILFSLAIYLAVNQLFPVRPRPEAVSAVTPIISHLPDNSFPSGHAIFAAAALVAALLFPKNRYLTAVICTFGILMMLARVIAGFHYPGDMIVGAMLGTVFALVFYHIHQHAWIQAVCIRFPIRFARLFRL